MRSKAPLAMLEQLVMLLVFALAAALCLQAFVLSNQMSERNALRDEAITQVQQVAEVVKYCGGDLEQTREILGGEPDETGLRIPCDGGTVTVTLTQSSQTLLGTARVSMTDAAGEVLFEVPVSWQTGGRP